MSSAEHRNWNIRQRFALALVCPALLLLLNSVCWAQTVTATPVTIADPAKPPLVTLTIKTGENIDTAMTEKVDSVKVDDQPPVKAQKDDKGNKTFTPPANLLGPQPIQLLDKDGKPLLDSAGKQLGPITLTYLSGGGPNANPTQTPDLNRLQAENEIKRQNDLVSKWWYHLLIASAFTFMFVMFVYTIVKAILRSRATFRSPLGMPDGSFRAIIAYTLVAFLGFYVLTSLLTVSDFKPPDSLLGIVATVIGFYFGSRSTREGGIDEKAGKVRGIVRKDTPGSGALVSGAMVKFKRDDGTEPYSRITDVDGRFVLLDAKAGKYKLTATVTGSTTSGQLDVNITEGSDQEIEIVIKSAAAAGVGGATGGGTQPAAGSVKGTVTQPDGKPATAGTTITLKGNKTFTAQSVEGGSYTIDKVEAGQYTAVASSPDFAPSKSVTVKVVAGEAKQLDLKLETKT